MSEFELDFKPFCQQNRAPAVHPRNNFIVMLLNVRQYGDPVLRAVSAPVEKITDDLKNLVENMVETMYATEGIGLAAPQVGVNIRLVVIDIPEDEEEGEEPEMITVNGEQKPMRSIMPLAFVNPEIEPYGKQELFTEGCLSVRGIRANVSRPDHVRARLTLLDGSELVLDCGGLLARCLQHECDHLDGFLFVDRVSSAAKITLAKKLKKLASSR